MLKGRGEVVHLMAVQAHGRLAGHRPPVGHRLDHVSQGRQGQGGRQGKVGAVGHQGGQRHDRPHVSGQPRFRLAVLVRKRVEVKGRRQPPLRVADMQNAEVLQVVVHVGDQEVEHDAAPQLTGDFTAPPSAWSSWREPAWAAAHP